MEILIKIAKYFKYLLFHIFKSFSFIYSNVPSKNANDLDLLLMQFTYLYSVLYLALMQFGRMITRAT